MNEINKQAIDLATQHAHFLIESVDNVAGVTLGGSLSKDEIIDTSSDVDMFVYINSETLPATSTLAQQLDVEQINIRRRTYLLEYRLFLNKYDTNVKFFTLKYLEQYIRTVPNLDPQYLEEIESYINQKVLVDNSKIKLLLSESQNSVSEKALALLPHAIERYGKCVSWAIFQWRNRGYATVAVHSLFAAFDCLLCAYYLSEGQFPPSLKWRASERAITQLRDGKKVFELVSKWMQQAGSFNINSSLSTLRVIENIVSKEFTLVPWDLYVEKWWWLGLGILR